MLALEILKNCRERGQKRAGGLPLDEAIAELLALQENMKSLTDGVVANRQGYWEAMKPKTCKLCVYCEPFNSVCFNDKSPLCADFVNSEYGCIYWERKATT